MSQRSMYLYVLTVVIQANFNSTMRSLMVTLSAINSLGCETFLSEEKLGIYIKTHDIGLTEILRILKLT